MKKERFEAITDAVLAIIITLMVLEIKIPELTLENLPKVFQQIFIYAVSFTYIAILWLNHHHMFVKVKTVSITIVWINFALLFFTSILPMATEHLNADFHQKANHIFFGLIMTVVTFLYSLL
ncbi:MAG TPA: TMEM175 family protein [Flavobacterium sp.]|uniref:TMEM175 family protein n=1 Tax=Flavobacterium sp. TaxID=239 RepID=UPI002BAADBB1|nr:TMEM175 family protein [Flavobacterium sp.]HNP33702.1 TMEM175 family protein [Flavobacterium sp.]